MILSRWIGVLLLPTSFLLAQEKAQKIAALMEAAQVRGVFNGNVLVRHSADIAYEGSFGYADSSRSAPLSSTNAFYIGSIAKEFNGAGILLLCRQGKIKLTDKVSQYLPGYPPWADTIEVRHLLNYTSSMPPRTGVQCSLPRIFITGPRAWRRERYSTTPPSVNWGKASDRVKAVSELRHSLEPGSPRIEHQGAGYNNEALILSDADDKTTIVLLTNNQNFNLYDLKDAIVAILHGQAYAVPKKSIYLDIREGLAADFKQGLADYLRLRRDHQDTYDFAAEPMDLISTGKYLLRRNKLDDALAMFELSTTFPLTPSDLSYAYELIAQTWSKQGNKPLAVFY